MGNKKKAKEYISPTTNAFNGATIKRMSVKSSNFSALDGFDYSMEMELDLPVNSTFGPKKVFIKFSVHDNIQIDFL